MARAHGVRVIETSTPGKAHALRLGDAAASTFPRLYADADIDLTAESVRVLVDTLARPGVLATSPVPHYDLTGARPSARRLHKVHELLMADRRGLAGRGRLLPQRGRPRHARVAPFPDVISDDGLVHRASPRANGSCPGPRRAWCDRRRRSAPACRRRVRVRQGNLELDALGLPRAEGRLRLGALVDLVRGRRITPVDAGWYLVLLAADRAQVRWRRMRGAEVSWGTDGVEPTRDPSVRRGRLTWSSSPTGASPPAPEAAPGPTLGTWGLPEWHRDQDALLLGAAARRHEHDLSPAEVRRLLRGDPSALAEVLPTFAAAVSTPSGGTSVATDYLGFRHVFHGQRDGTGDRLHLEPCLRHELGSGLDLEAVAVQSSLGWQLGQRTLFDGVAQARAGRDRDPGGRRASPSRRTAGPGSAERLELDRAVRTAAELLRTYLTAYLEDHPDAGLQLTGGQDSRLLLSAIPEAQRRGLRVVTLGVSGDPDVDIAAELAARYGMRHEILSLSGLEDLDPAAAYELCLDAARRLDYTADPLAHAALTYAEARSEPGPRISGLGGEVARGFYYLGPPTDGARLGATSPAARAVADVRQRGRAGGGARPVVRGLGARLRHRTRWCGSSPRPDDPGWRRRTTSTSATGCSGGAG